jgi:hypothetical protein
VNQFLVPVSKKFKKWFLRYNFVHALNENQYSFLFIARKINYGESPSYYALGYLVHKSPHIYIDDVCGIVQKLAQFVLCQFNTHFKIRVDILRKVLIHRLHTVCVKGHLFTVNTRYQFGFILCHAPPRTKTHATHILSYFLFEFPIFPNRLAIQQDCVRPRWE